MVIDKTLHRWRAFRCEPHRSWPPLSEPLAAHFETLGALLEQYGVRDGQYFLLGPDGRPDLSINAFLSSSAMRVLSEGTNRKYAYSLAIWLNFLHQRYPGRPWYQATSADVADLKFWRMSDVRNERRVTGATWHGDLAALSAFYAWAGRMYKIPSPIELRALKSPRYQSRLPVPLYSQALNEQNADDTGSYEVTHKAAEPAGIRDRDVKWFTPRAYQRWVNLGLRGLALDGEDAPDWRGRNAERDAAFADLLYGTGLRLQEGGSLLVNELPPLHTANQFYTCKLAASCAKYSRGRRYWMPSRVREALDQYIGPEGERSRAVARAQRANRYETLPGLYVVEQIRNQTLRLRKRAGATIYDVPLDTLTPRERWSLFLETPRGLEPLALWLNEDGLPRHHHSWDVTFHIANRRIQRLGIDHFICSPHKLRHSFAFKWYITGRLLYERKLDHLSPEEIRDFRFEFGSTWELVRTLLGHRSVETTREIYMEPFQTLEVESLLATAAHLNPETLDVDFRAHARVRTDPLSSADGI